MNAIYVLSLLPLWRYAVGPSSGRSPAIPFYRRHSADAFFDKAVRDLPFSGCRIYKRTFKGLVVVREYTPN